MTACLVNRVPSGKVVLAADTIVSSNEPIPKNSYQVDWSKRFYQTKGSEELQSGSTVLGQRFQQTSDIRMGTFRYFSESAAKIGVINSKFPFNCAGDEDAILKFMQNLLINEAMIVDLASLEHYIKNTVDSLEAKGILGHLIISFAYQQGEKSFLVYLEVSSGLKRFGITPLESNENVGWTFGSGESALKKEFSSENSFTLWKNASLYKDLYPTLVMCDLSILFSNPFRNPIPQELFGGIFLAFATKEEGIDYPQTYIHLFINEEDQIVFALKFHYEDGLFFVHDLLGQHLNIMETVDRRVREPKKEFPPMARLAEIAKHDAPWLFITTETNDKNYITNIFGTGEKNAFIGHIEDPKPDNFDPNYWFGPGMIFSTELNGIKKTFHSKPRNV